MLSVVRLLAALMVAAGTLAAAEPGFVSLFDGKTLEGWQMFSKHGSGYVV